MTNTIYYYNPETGEWPRFPGDIQLIDSNWNIELPLPEPWVEVADAFMPTLGENQTFVEDEPIKNKDGTYKRNVTVRDLTEEELKHKQYVIVKNKVMDNIKLTQEEAALLTE